MLFNRKTQEEKDAFNERFTMRAYAYKLKPNVEQTKKLEDTVETCRHLYNACRWEYKKALEDGTPLPKYTEQVAAHVRDRRKGHEYLSRVDAHVLHNVVDRAGKSFKDYFSRTKAWKKNGRIGPKPGFPRFKGEGRYDSFCDPGFGHDVSRGRCMVRPSTTGSKYGFIQCAGIGWIKMFYDRPIEGKVRTATFIKKADGWHVRITAIVEKVILPNREASVGIDLGIEWLATLSTGEHIENPRFMKKHEARLKRAQRRLSRRDGPNHKKGKHTCSNRWKKARALLSIQHAHVANARRENIRRVVHKLVSQYGTIIVEDLKIGNMVKNHHLAKAIYDVGWGLLVSMLGSKVESTGGQLKKVPPQYTSQDCSNPKCGARIAKKLSQRTHTCPYCGLKLHRDHNAALNIKQRAESSALGEVGARASSQTENHTYVGKTKRRSAPAKNQLSLSF